MDRLQVWLGWQVARLARPGQGLVEYSLLLGLIALIVVAVLAATGNTLSTLWYNKILGAF